MIQMYDANFDPNIPFVLKTITTNAFEINII